MLAFEGVERKWLLLGCGILMPLLMKDAWTVAAAPELVHLCLLQPSRPWSPLGSGKSEELEFVDVSHLESQNTVPHVFPVLEKLD